MYINIVTIAVNVALLNFCVCLHVQVHNSSDDVLVEPFKTQINKRDLSNFFDRASYSFIGFKKIANIPVLFPNDICLMNIEGVKYAACVHIHKSGVPHFVVYRIKNGYYQLLIDISAPLAIAMDCHAMGSNGYVALAYNISGTLAHANHGSPVYVISEDRVRAVQYFSTPNLRSIYLRSEGSDLFLLQTLSTVKGGENLFCPYFKWSESSFDKRGTVPCSNARRLELFSIEHESYIAVANYADQHGRTETYSKIYIYNKEKKQLELIQKIKTYGAVDVKYFSVPFNEVNKKHFLIFANSVGSVSAIGERGLEQEADSVFYVFEKGQFIPYQKLSLYAVEKFLPIHNVELEKFILLVACTNHDIKIYNFNDWKFQESHAQFTEGALAKGISNMRIFQENETSYLVVANERVAGNQTNIFQPIFKQEEHANNLRQEIIEWTKSTINRLVKMDVNKLKREFMVIAALVEEQDKDAAVEIEEIPHSNIQLVKTKSLIYNRRHFTTNYWRALSYAHQAIEALELRMSEKQAEKRQAEEINVEYAYKNLNVGTLVVSDKLRASKVNDVDTKNVQLKSVLAPKVIVARNYEGTKAQDTLNVEHLKISGSLNEYPWDMLLGKTLKRSGNQFFKAPLDIAVLEAETVKTANDSVNECDLGKLVTTDFGSYVVNQDIQFSKPIRAKNMIVTERLNNIHVFQNKFDVLLTNTTEPQLITGSMRFENLKLRDPVIISGKIMGKHLESMIPSKQIHNDITLHGNYTITGDVKIKNQFSADNLIGASGQWTAKDILKHGFRLDIPIEGINVNFQQPIEANRSIVSFVNGHDLQHLVRTNCDKVQVIEGAKTFSGTNLTISKGFGEVKMLNGIDIEDLSDRLLMRSGNQTITGKIHVKKITSNRIDSPSIKLHTKDLSQFLCKNGNQDIQGSLKVNKITANSATFQHLESKGKIFNEHLPEFFQQWKRKAPSTNDLFSSNSKFPGTINVENLQLQGTINGKSIEAIERLLVQLEGNIRYVGEIKFTTAMTIKNLTFHGNFNGISTKDFGQCWLQKKNYQKFTAPQIISGVLCDRGIHLDGKLNGYEMQDFFSNTFWVNRNEQIPVAIFNDKTKIKGTLLSNTVNGLQVPDDILQRQSSKPQTLNGNLFAHRDIFVNDGEILNATEINGMNLYKLKNYLNDTAITSTLVVQHANFVNEPIFKTLNGHNLEELLQNVWLANNDVVLQHDIEMSDVYFEGPLKFKGSVNGVNLNHLNENYFSLSRKQNISTDITFSSGVKFKSNFYSDNMDLLGQIVDTTSQVQFDFLEVVQNTLLKSGRQQVTAQWHVIDGVVTGDLTNIRINGLNLVDDVVRKDVSLNIVSAPKQIHSASIENLYCKSLSTVNKVNVANWIRDAVFVYENYTIQGKTTLDSVILYNDLKVLGTVNSVKFDKQTLMLRDRKQEIRGNIRLITKYPDRQQILANNFEALNTATVNGLNVNLFFSKQAKVGFAANIHGNLIFANPFRADEYDGSIRMYDNRTIQPLDQLQKVLQNLKTNYENVHYYLSHFEIRQTLQIRATNIINLTLRLGGNFFDIIGILDNEDKSRIHFYRWDQQMEKFLPDKKLSWLPQEKTLIDIFKIAFHDAEFLSLEAAGRGKAFPNTISVDTEGLKEIFLMKHNRTAKIEGFQLGKENCFVLYSNESSEIPVFCLQSTKGQPRLIIAAKSTIQRSGVRQVLSLKRDYIAVLLSDAVEIWNPSEPTNPKQRIPLINPVQLAVAVSKDVIFLAICVQAKPNNPHDGTVIIFRSINDYFFEQMQKIEPIYALQMEFTQLSESADILLYVLTESFDQPMVIYRYLGASGFQQIIASSTISSGGRAISPVHLKANGKHFIAIIGKNDVKFLEIVTKSS